LLIAQDLIGAHNFDGASLGRSFLDISRRGHVAGHGIADIAAAYRELTHGRPASASELGAMVASLEKMVPELRPLAPRQQPSLDYRTMVEAHNPRARKK